MEGDLSASLGSQIRRLSELSKGRILMKKTFRSKKLLDGAKKVAKGDTALQTGIFPLIKDGNYWLPIEWKNQE